MLRFLTSGESHGKYLSVTLEGIPAGLKINEEDINKELKRRQKGYGRSDRMKIETEQVKIISGVIDGKTTSAPITLLLENKSRGMGKKLTKPRPGHADLAGVLKYGVDDIRYISERASARETVMRVAAGAVCKKFLSEFGIKIYSWVEEIGGIRIKNDYSRSIDKIYRAVERSYLRCPEKSTEKMMIMKIDQARKKGDSLGGVFRVLVKSVPPGLGSHIQWDLKLDGRISQAIASIPAVKGVEIGLGFRYSKAFGSEVHDEILFDKKYYRKTNNAGGIEGGISNGEDILVGGVMKPISTLAQPLRTIDILTKKPSCAEVLRADVCAIASCAVVAEAMAAYVIAQAFLEKFGGDNLQEIKRNFSNYIDRL